MAPLEQAELDKLSTRTKQQLSSTSYACTSLTVLSGGTANFVFRGILAEPLLISRNGTVTTVKSVIIKHSTGFVAVNRDFPLDVSRCIFEELMLTALNDLPAFTTDHISVKTPRIYLFNRDTNTQIHEDFPSALDLKSFLVSPTANRDLSQPFATSIGYALGSWLRTFHTWTSAPAQAELRKQIGQNSPMRELKYLVSYKNVIQIVEQFPEILEGNRKTLEDVRAMAIKEFTREAGDGGGENWGIIHGDLWSGNVLLRDVSLKLPTELIVIDWELTQFGHFAYDLGQMIGDLYERKHLKDVDGVKWIIQAFTDGYGQISDNLAFRTAIHVGVHLIYWCNRQAPTTPLTAPPKRIANAVKLGTDWIVKGWERDRKWFGDSALAPLFGRD